MKLISIAVLRVDEDDSKDSDGNKAVILCQETDTSGIWVGKGSMKEMARFISREIACRIEMLQMKSLEYKGNICHAYKQQNGLTVCVLTDDKYPPRGAHGVARNVLREFEAQKKPQEWQNAKDLQMQWPRLLQLMSAYKDPPS